jgi:hypothetical protein
LFSKSEAAVAGVTHSGHQQWLCSRLVLTPAQTDNFLFGARRRTPSPPPGTGAFVAVCDDDDAAVVDGDDDDDDAAAAG